MKRGISGRTRGLAILACAGLIATGITTIPAYAGTAPPWNVADAVVDSTGDPGVKAHFADPYGNSKELGPINGNGYKVLVIHGTGVPVLGKTNPNAGTDMTEAWIATETDGDGDIWGYFAFRIESFTTGQSAWEFMKDKTPAACDYSATEASLIASCNPWANRQDGDFFIVADYQGNSVVLKYREWSEVNGALVLGPPVDIPASIGAGSVNGTTGIVEMAVNLTDGVFGNLASCTTIGNIIPSTLTGNSDQADYKDVILAGVADAVNISNCGSFVVTKKLNPSTASTDGNTFGWTLDRTAGAALRYNVAGDPGQNGETQLTGTLTSHNDSDGPEVNLIAGNNYQLAEAINFTAPNVKAFDLEKIECKVGSTGTLVAVPDGGTFTIAVGKTTYCEITNMQKTGTLNVYKTVTNDNGGTLDRSNFTVDVTGPNSYSQQDQVFGEDSAHAADLAYGLWTSQVPAGTYAAVEDDPSSSGYIKNDSACASVVVPAGGTGSCTITNNDKPAQLTVKKVVDNTAGGTAVAANFLFDVSGVNASQDNTFAADPDHPADTLKGATTLTGLTAGAYGVTEDGAAGTPLTIVKGGVTYAVTYSADCTGTLALGGSKTCTITNTALKASPSGTTVQSWVLHDELTLSGVRGDPEGDTITFTLYSDAACTVVVDSDTGTVDANGKAKTSTGVTVTDSGTYYWKASYPGDAFNNSFVTSCDAEVTQILAKDAKDGGRNDFPPVIE